MKNENPFQSLGKSFLYIYEDPQRISAVIQAADCMTPCKWLRVIMWKFNVDVFSFSFGRWRCEAFWLNCIQYVYLLILKPLNIEKHIKGIAAYPRIQLFQEYSFEVAGYISAVTLACKQALLFGQAKWASRERASEGPRKAELATISHKFSFPPRKTRDSAKRENCHLKRATD